VPARSLQEEPRADARRASATSHLHPGPRPGASNQGPAGPSVDLGVNDERIGPGLQRSPESETGVLTARTPTRWPSHRRAHRAAPARRAARHREGGQPWSKKNPQTTPEPPQGAARQAQQEEPLQATLHLHETIRLKGPSRLGEGGQSAEPLRPPSPQASGRPCNSPVSSTESVLCWGLTLE